MPPGNWPLRVLQDNPAKAYSLETHGSQVRLASIGSRAGVPFGCTGRYSSIRDGTHHASTAVPLCWTLDCRCAIAACLGLGAIGN